MNSQPSSFSDVARSRRTNFWLLILIAFISLFLIISFFFVRLAATHQPLRVEGDAMSPTLNDGDRVFMSRDVREIKRGDIIVFYFPKDTTKSYIKRVIGLPGEEIRIEKGKIFANGIELSEPYLEEKYLSNETLRAIQLDSESYYVMGDNRYNSYDSRNWGALPRNLIYGRFVVRY